MAITTEPDQRPDLWTDHVSVYETVFEPFSLAFADGAARSLSLRPGDAVLDVGAGSGGAALSLARLGCRVTAIDASPGMVARIAQRAGETGMSVDARVMDGQALGFPDASFDAAISVFGVILFPDAVRGLAEMRRVVRPGGRVAIVTWTEPQNYELAAELRAAIDAVQPAAPPSKLPAQLRFRERAACEALFTDAGFDAVDIVVQSASLRAPSAAWLAERLQFAPGMRAMLAGLGAQLPRVLARFVADVEARQGTGEVSFAGKAFVATAQVR